MFRRIRKPVLIVLGIIVACILGELTLRFLNPLSIQPELSETYTFPCYSQGSLGYWISLKKNAHCILHSNAHAFPDVSVDTNSMGLRNSEVGLKQAGAKRILFLGDSFVMGMGVTSDETFASLVAKSLATPGHPVEAVNAGLPTADAGYYYLFLKNAAPKLDPDTVVIGFYPYNDVHDNEVRDVWDAVDNQGLPTHIGSGALYIDYTGDIYSNSLPSYLKLPVIRDSRLAMLLAYMNAQAPWTNHLVKLPLVSEQLCLFRAACHTFDNEVSRTERLFTAMRDIAKERNQKLLIVMIPAKFQVLDTARYEFNIPVALSPAEKSYPETRWGSFFQSQQIDYLDLLPVMIAHPNPSPYFTHDNHWNTLGHTLAAQAIIEKLAPTPTP